MTSTLPCRSGWYCTGGVATLCEGGRFGCADRLSEPNCNGPCPAGFYCPAGSVSSQQYPCGCNAGNARAAWVYCPEGVEAPRAVGLGNYSVPVEVPVHRRTAEAACPPGSYCIDGVKVRVDAAGKKSRWRCCWSD